MSRELKFHFIRKETNTRKKYQNGNSKADLSEGKGEEEETFPCFCSRSTHSLNVTRITHICEAHMKRYLSLIKEMRIS